MFAENCSTRTFFLTAAIYISIKCLRKALNSRKRQIIAVSSTLGQSTKENRFTQTNMEGNICSKLKKSRKFGRNRKL